MHRHPFAIWVPYVVLAILVIASGLWLVVLLSPIAKALAVGASLALLTHGTIFRRVDRYLAEWWPWPAIRRQAAASIALAVLVAAALGAALAILWAALGGLSLTFGAVWGVAVQDPETVRGVTNLLTERVGDILRLYPAIPLSTDDVRGWIANLLHQVAVGPTFLRTVVSGGGSAVVEIVLTTVFTWWLYVHGPALGGQILGLLPADERQPIAERLRERAGALVLGTFGRALVVGIYLGLVAWLIGGFQPVLVAAVAMLASVMPLLGPVFVWLPLASLLASQDHWLLAGLLAVCSQGGAMSIAWVLDRRAEGAPLQGTGPVLLLTMVGGLLGFGARGLILAPAALVLALSAWDALTSLSPTPVARGDEDV